MALGFLVAVTSCGGGGTKATTGGSSAATAKGGGSSSGGGQTAGSAGSSGSSCTATEGLAACGGDVVGAWTVTGCLKLTGEMDLSSMGLGCRTGTVTGSLQVTGTWTATADGKYTDKTTTSGDEQLALPATCLLVSGTTTTCDALNATIESFGYESGSVSCTNAASGGGCSCSAKIQMPAGIGILSMEPPTNGKYTTSGNVVTTDNEKKYSYCVSGNKMTWTPQIAGQTITGAIVFQKSGGSGGSTDTGGTSGAAGATGSGGATPTGGTTSVGGRTGSGSATVAGGTTAAGGTTSVAGRTGSGGATPTAGTTSAGGRTGSGGATVAGGTTGAAGSTSVGTNDTGPCDIYAAASTPCVAAYSMGRVLQKDYTGPLYQVRVGGDKLGTGGTLKDIAAKDGLADSAAHEAACGTTTGTCTVATLYDQSGKKNDLKVAPAGCYNDGSANLPDYESDANSRSYTLGGRKVYALKTKAREGYRNNKTTGLPTGNKDQGVYMVNDGKYYGTACCFDFGQASPDNCNGGVMNTLFFGTGYWGKGAGSGPWYEGDFEGGVWACGSGASNVTCSGTPSMTMDFPFGLIKTSSGLYAIRNGNAQSGALTTNYDGKSPKTWANAGAIVLGIGGDNSNHSFGTFFEGAVTAGRPSDATDDAVLKNVQAAGFVK
jgi:hypothetical protein